MSFGWKGSVAVGLVLAGTAWGAFTLGAALTQGKWDAEKLTAAQHTTGVVVEQKAVESRVVTQYVDRVRTIYKQGATITKEVPVYVTKEDDARCSINHGFVSVWNAANAGVPLSRAAGITDGEASGVALSDVATQHTVESQYTLELEERLIALQDWAAGVAAVR